MGILVKEKGAKDKACVFHTMSKTQALPSALFFFHKKAEISYHLQLIKNSLKRRQKLNSHVKFIAKSKARTPDTVFELMTHNKN